MIILDDKHKTSLIIGIVFVTIGFFVKVFYRDFISNNETGVMSWADTLSCFLYVIGFSQIFLIKPFKYPSLVILFVVVGSIINEYKISFRTGMIDVNDIIASVAGGAISLLILYIVAKKFKNVDK